MHRLGIVDIGTNSTLYLIAERHENSLHYPDQGAQTTRLGRDIQKTGIIGDQGLTDTVRALREYQSVFQNQGIMHIIATGTQVFRIAKNQAQILEAIRRQTGLTVRVLSEQEEAEASFKGALNANPAENVIVLDIGGGSVEVHGGSAGIDASASFPIGAVVMTDRFFSTDRPSGDEQKRMRRFITDTVGTAWQSRLKQAVELFVVGGTATTLSAVRQALDHYIAEKVHLSRLTGPEVRDLLAQFCSCNLAERQRLLHLDPKRADIIIAGTLILKTIMELGGFAGITVSDHGLRHGIAKQMLENPDS